jgi:hypothetical protein
LEQQEQQRIQHLETLSQHKISIEELTSRYDEKIRELESEFETQRAQLDERSNEILGLRSSLAEMTEAKELCEKQRDAQIQRFETYQEIVFENEKANSERWEERRRELEATLVETEEALLVAQSTVKTYVSLLVPSCPCPSLQSLTLSLR